MAFDDSLDTIADIIQKAMPLITTIIAIINNDALMSALQDSDKLTDEQKAQITAMRNTAVSEWDSLAPSE